MTKPGYEIQRDERGLTGRERQVLDEMTKGETFAVIAERIGVSKQRVGALVNSLVEKGYVVRSGGDFAVVVRKNAAKKTDDER